MHNFQSWLATNGSWLGPLEALVFIALFVWGVVKFFGHKILDLFSRLGQKFTGKRTIPNTRITFVLNPQRTFWNMASRDNKAVMQIMTSWYATNASNVPLHILGVKLINPNPSGRICTEIVDIIERQNNWAHSGIDMAIKPSQTEVVEAMFFVEPPTQKEGQPLKIKMYVVDQYNRKHKMPRIRLQYKFPSAETY
ncbi:MAG: hypothetical protein ACYC49_00145 [Ignavibacteriaceae bacterium]